MYDTVYYNLFIYHYWLSGLMVKNNLGKKYKITISQYIYNQFDIQNIMLNKDLYKSKRKV